VAPQCVLGVTVQRCRRVFLVLRACQGNHVEKSLDARCVLKWNRLAAFCRCRVELPTLQQGQQYM
jgi:hypothetical protein